MDPLAIYAAVVATAALGWQVFTRWQSRRAAVKVEVTHAAERQEGVLQLPGPRRGELGYRVMVIVSNRGETTQFVDAFGIRAVEDETAMTFEVPDDKALRPAQSMRGQFWLEALSLEVDGRFVGFAGLATGEVVESRPQELHAALLTAIEHQAPGPH
ncbi:MAG TPA: hypothetical protein VK506_05025 [Conexibacter sp.]|nr:hypothetical protein [Conexibacter sp.]